MGPHRPRLLLVEDDRASRVALARILELLGCEVAQAASVAEGLSGLDPPPDCLVTDLMLPDGAGEALLCRVRREGLPTRVVVCTGAYDPTRLGAVAALGAAAVLRKPLDSRGLRRLVEVARAGDPGSPPRRGGPGRAGGHECCGARRGIA